MEQKAMDVLAFERFINHYQSPSSSGTHTLDFPISGVPGRVDLLDLDCGVIYWSMDLQLHDALAWQSRTRAGVHILLLLQGDGHFSLGEDTVDVTPLPKLIMMGLPDGIVASHHLSSHQSFRCLGFSLSEKWLAEQASRPYAAASLGLKWLAERIDSGERLLTTQIDGAFRGIAAQILSTPLSGPARALYLEGKCLELLGYLLPSLEARFLREAERVAESAGNCNVVDPRPTPATPTGLSSAEIDQLFAARTILEAEFRKPPSLEALGRRVGLNSKRLKNGFPRLFGTTMHRFLHSYRMERAHALLATNGMHPGEVAAAIGYSHAYFSTAFRKQFGLSPSEVAGRGK